MCFEGGSFNRNRWDAGSCTIWAESFFSSLILSTGMCFYLLRLRCLILVPAGGCALRNIKCMWLFIISTFSSFASWHDAVCVECPEDQLINVQCYTADHMTAPDSQACCVVLRTCVRKCFYWINHVVWEQRTTVWYIRSTERCIQDTDQQPACFSCLNALIEINLWMFDLFLSPTDPLPGRLFF